MKWRIDREVLGFNGNQSFWCEAKTKEEAMKKFNAWEDHGT